MDSKRLSKVSRLVQKELSDYFQKNSRNYGTGILVSVTEAKVSPDLQQAKIYVSIFPSNQTTEVFKLIEENGIKIKHELATRTRQQLRRVPELHFYIDDSLDKIERIEELLKK